MTRWKDEIQNRLELNVITNDEFISIRMNLDNWKRYTNGTDCQTGDKKCRKSKSLLLQVFIYEKEKIEEWNALKLKNDIDGLKQMTAKDNDGLSKWGIVDIIILEQNCDAREINLSSTDVVNDYRQLLIQDKSSIWICQFILNDFKSFISEVDFIYWYSYKRFHKDYLSST